MHTIKLMSYNVQAPTSPNYQLHNQYYALTFFLFERH